METIPEQVRARRYGKYCSVVLAAALIFAFATPAAAMASSPGPVTLVEMANDACPVSASPTTCSGGYTPTQTFQNPLLQGEIVTVTMAYLYSNVESATFSLSDSLGNTITLVSSQCSVSTPIVCTAIGYFDVVAQGLDDISFSELGGNTGVMWYNAEIWQATFGSSQVVTGTNGSCPSSCSGQLSLGPLSSSGYKESIGLSVYAAVYPNTPATWQPSYPYSYYFTDCAGLGQQCQGGDSILWQATTSNQPSHTFSATTSPVPVVWDGSAELVNWS